MLRKRDSFEDEEEQKPDNSLKLSKVKVEERDIKSPKNQLNSSESESQSDNELLSKMKEDDS